MDTIRKFHILALDSTRTDLMIVDDYDIEKIDITKFWRNEKIYDSEKLLLKVHEEGKDITDAVGNPLSLFIFSEKLVNIINSFLSESVQLLDANLFGKNGKIKGFKIVHCIRAIRCLDINNSKVSYSDDNKLSIVGSVTILEKNIPKNIHFFRIEEDKNTVVVSDELAQTIVGKNINGIAFIKCKSN